MTNDSEDALRVLMSELEAVIGQTATAGTTASSSPRDYGLTAAALRAVLQSSAERLQHQRGLKPRTLRSEQTFRTSQMSQFATIVWYGRPGSNRHEPHGPTDFRTTSAFAAAARRSWSGLSLRRSRGP